MNILGLVLILIGIGYFLPFYKPQKRLLTVWRFEKTGRAPRASRQKNEWISPKKLERLLAWAKKHRFTLITASQLAASKGRKTKLPKRALLLAFTGGFQNFYTEAFPVLKRFNAPATVFLPAGALGGYNQWQNPNSEPWQNLLTLPQLRELAQSGLVEFGADPLEYAPGGAFTPEEAVWQFSQSKARLKKAAKLDVCTLHYPASNPLPAVHRAVLQHGFTFAVGAKEGVNRQSVYFKYPLQTLSPKNATPLWRLYFKMTRG